MSAPINFIGVGRGRGKKKEDNATDTVCTTNITSNSTNGNSETNIKKSNIVSEVSRQPIRLPPGLSLLENAHAANENLPRAQANTLRSPPGLTRINKDDPISVDGIATSFISAQDAARVSTGLEQRVVVDKKGRGKDSRTKKVALPTTDAVVLSTIIGGRKIESARVDGPETDRDIHTSQSANTRLTPSCAPASSPFRSQHKPMDVINSPVNEGMQQLLRKEINIKKMKEEVVEGVTGFKVDPVASAVVCAAVGNVEDGTCLLCSQEAIYWAIGSCNHSFCHICAMR